MLRSFLSLVFFVGLFSAAAEADNISVEEMDGGRNVTMLSGSIVVNERSSLRRRFYVLNDASAPLQLRFTGIRTDYRDRGYKFSVIGAIKASADVRAFHVVFVLLDVFGDRMRGLGYLSVEDIAAGQERNLGPSTWYADENDVERYLICISYVSRVRLGDGSVWTARLGEITEKIQQIGIQATAGDLKEDEKVRR